jgi:hypothetical protein
MRLLAALIISLTGTAWAQSAVEFAPGEREQIDTKAHALRQQAESMRHEADKQQKIEHDACWKKFLVNSCMDDAKQRRTERIIEARKVEQEARDLERGLRQREAEIRAARWAEEQPRKDAEAAARAERNRQDQQTAMERVERKRAEAEKH